MGDSGRKYPYTKETRGRGISRNEIVFQWSNALWDKQIFVKCKQEYFYISKVISPKQGDGDQAKATEDQLNLGAQYSHWVSSATFSSE